MPIFDLDKDETAGRSASEYEIRSIHSYIVPSVISILFCGMVGIVATVYSILTIQAKHRMDYESAIHNSNSARGWMIAAYIVGIFGTFFAWYGRGGRF